MGLIPTRLFLLLGDTMLPSVSLPSAAAARPIALPIALPELEPDGSACGKYGLVACPPRPDHPDARSPRKCAHSDRFALPAIAIVRQTWIHHEGDGCCGAPSMIAPALRRFFTTPASSGTTDRSKLKEPAVVFKPVRVRCQSER